VQAALGTAPTACQLTWGIFQPSAGSVGHRPHRLSINRGGCFNRMQAALGTAHLRVNESGGGGVFFNRAQLALGTAQLFVNKYGAGIF
jgi:hypothetical protein